MPGIEINKDLLFVKLKHEDSLSAMTFLADKMFEEGYVKKDYKDSILKREQAFPTGLVGMYCNFALTHTEIDLVVKSGFAAATMRKPVKFERMDDDYETVDVDIIFMLALDGPDGHMYFLQKLVELMRDKSFVDQVLAAEDNERLSQLLKERF